MGFFLPLAVKQVKQTLVLLTTAPPSSSSETNHWEFVRWLFLFASVRNERRFCSFDFKFFANNLSARFPSRVECIRRMNTRLCTYLKTIEQCLCNTRGSIDCCLESTAIRMACRSSASRHRRERQLHDTEDEWRTNNHVSFSLINQTVVLFYCCCVLTERWSTMAQSQARSWHGEHDEQRARLTTSLRS